MFSTYYETNNKLNFLLKIPKLDYLTKKKEQTNKQKNADLVIRYPYSSDRY